MKSKPITLAALLEHEAAFPRHNERKEKATRNRFGVGPTRYYQELEAAIDEQREEALRLDAVTVRRLLDLRQQRAQRRLRSVLGRDA